MAFRHIKHLVATTLDNHTLYTVPTGREFVLMRKRIRNSQGNDGTCSFNISEGDSIDSIEFSSSDIVKHGESSKLLVEEGSRINAYLSTMANGTTVEIMGIELPAGSWVKVKEGSDTPSVNGYIVSGAGNDSYNGTYIRGEDQEIAPYGTCEVYWLNNTQGSIALWGNSETAGWNLEDTHGNDFPNSYPPGYSSETGDITGTWTTIEATGPAPGVSWGGGGSSSSSEPEPSSSSSGAITPVLIPDGNGNYRLGDGITITGGPSWLNGNWYYCGRDWNVNGFTANGMIWRNGDSSQDCIGSNLNFWQARQQDGSVGKYIGSNGSNYGYMLTVGTDETYYDEITDEISFLFTNSNPQFYYIYNNQTTTPEQHGWETGYYDYDSDPMGVWQTVSSGTLSCVYWNGSN